MKTHTTTSDKNSNSTLAFLPEMVLEHLKQAKPIELKKTDSKNDKESNDYKSKTIVFEPMADPFDDDIEIKQKFKKLNKIY